jgi:hypothetical protein
MRIVPVILFLLCRMLSAADSTEAVTREILALERQAMDGFQAGNPDLALAMVDPEITYFHVVTNQRVEGLPALKALFEPYRGRPLFDTYQIAEPKLQLAGDVAILTYTLVQTRAGEATRWHGTQIYRHKKEGWRVLHSHWSAVRQ